MKREETQDRREVGLKRPAIRGASLLGGVLLAFSFATACATTTIQTGNQFEPERQRFGSNDPEESFFTELSEQDPAFRNGEPDRNFTAQPVAEADCPCEDERPAAVVAADGGGRGRNNPAANTEENYFNTENNSANDREVTPIPVATTATAEQTPPADERWQPTTDGSFNEIGTASWYGRDFDGKPTASGDIFDSRKLTAAHKSIPLGSIVLVRNMENNKEVLVTINDRGPFVSGRVIDMSEYGAELLGYKEQGLAQVGLRVIRLGSGTADGRGATYEFFSGHDRFADNSGGGDAESERRAQQIIEADREAQQRPREDLRADEVRSEAGFQSYAIQVGIFSDLRNARNLERYLSSYGQPINVFQRGNMFVVKIGQFDTRGAAEELKHRLTMDGYNVFISAPGQ